MKKLADLAGPALSQADPKVDVELAALAGPLAGGLLELLRLKNGFYAFESALHVFPTQSGDVEIGLADWNSPGLWIDEYEDMASGCLFFAEDVFGCQFCIKSGSIFQFDPETARLEEVARDVEGWAAALLRDYQVLTGHPLGREWQRAHGPIAPGARLLPKIPFVTGGEFSVQNLYALDAVKGMRLRGSIARQIRHLPDGTAIRLKVVD